MNIVYIGNANGLFPQHLDLIPILSIQKRDFYN
jgi:hypothetical protein